MTEHNCHHLKLMEMEARSRQMEELREAERARAEEKAREDREQMAAFFAQARENQAAAEAAAQRLAILEAEKADMTTSVFAAYRVVAAWCQSRFLGVPQ